MRGSGDLEDAMRDAEERERRDAAAMQGEGGGRLHIGTVEHFFDKISVAAITLNGDLRVGDMIEIDDGMGLMLTQEVTSMQINRRDVTEAGSGDSVGIKLDRAVSRGSEVYKLTTPK